MRKVFDIFGLRLEDYSDINASDFGDELLDFGIYLRRYDDVWVWGLHGNWESGFCI